jgi:hypothetical protein
MQFKIYFDRKFLPINYELYTIKIIPLKILIYKSTDILFMIYISYLLLVKLGGQSLS